MSLKRKAVWLCLLAGCSLQATPKSSSGAQRTNVDAGEWRPDERPDAGERRSTSRAHDAGAEPQADAAAPVASGTHAQPAADSGKPQSDKAGTNSQAQGGKPADTAANGGKDGTSTPQDNGGTGGSESPPNKPTTEPAAGAPAQPSAGTPAATPVSGGTGGQAGVGGPRNVREALVDAVIGAMSRGNGNGNGNGNQGDWSSWRRAAGESGELAPEFVTPMLNALLLSGTCFERIETCVSVCVVVAQNCGPCVADKDCKAALSRVCGERAASCPGAMTMPPKP